MKDVEIFVQVVHNAPDLPEPVRARADQVRQLKASVVNQSLIEVLDTQIRLSSRGPEWEAKLRHRRDALVPYCNKALLKGRVDVGVDAYWIQVDPEALKVVYWELYEAWQEKL